MAEGMEGMTEQQKKGLKEVFDMFDKDGNGRITASELGTVMKALGQFPTDTELKDMIHEVDLDGSDTVNFDEFCVMMSKKVSADECDDELREAFNVFDKDRNGYINHEELKAAVESLGEKCTDQEIDAMITEVDENNDRLISYKEFKKMMRILK